MLILPYSMELDFLVDEDWSNIISPEFYERMIKARIPISIQYREVIYDRGAVIEYVYSCNVCKKTPCKHFIIKDGQQPILTKEAKLINKLVTGEYK